MTDILKFTSPDSLLCFFIQVFHTRNPGAELIEEGHFQRYIWQHVPKPDYSGDRLVVNQPPRTGKTLTASAALWQINPGPYRKIVFFSNAIERAEEHIRRRGDACESNWYRKTFPTTRIAEDRSARTAAYHPWCRIFAGSMRSSLGVGATCVMSTMAIGSDDAVTEHLERK